MVRKFGLWLKKFYIHLRWKRAVRKWFNHDSEPLFKLAKQLNKIHYELREIKRREKVL